MEPLLDFSIVNQLICSPLKGVGFIDARNTLAIDETYRLCRVLIGINDKKHVAADSALTTG